MTKAAAKATSKSSERSQPPTTVTNIKEFFRLCNGTTQLAARLELHAFTVEGWRRSGIPRKHWQKLIDFYGLSPAELHAICEDCTRSKAGIRG